ncbi:MAG: hypothetical protein JRJ29_13215 [Deltaproteobacteria bacterium]|nr:hypothetical protein [Deltaproteobacteria bacterium]
MRRVEYDITLYPASELRNVVYFCTSRGECERDISLASHLERLKGLMNQKGAEGWDLIQLLVGEEGIVGLWKRAVDLDSK